MRFRLTLPLLFAACIGGVGRYAIAQTARDSAHVRAEHVPLDSIQRFVLPPLTQYCSAKWVAQYVKTACAILTRQIRSAVVAESLLIVASPVTTNTTATATTEPMFDSTTAVMLLRDTMDEYANAAALMPPCQQLAGPRFYDRAWDTCAIGGTPDTTRVFVIPGRSGHAIRVSYTGTYQESWNITAGGFPDTGPNTAVVTVWSRLTGSIGAIKWIELFHLTGGRIQFNTHDNLPCPLGTHPLVWQVYDLAQTACQGNQPLGPYPTQLVDGQWHRYTYLYKPNSVAGARDGRALMWIDGTLVIDIEKATIGITPPGGEKPWCQADDVDGLSTAGFVEANFGGPLTTTPGPFTVDIDDFQLFRFKAA